MALLSPQTKFRLDLATFIVFSFLTVAEILALLHAPPIWLSNWPRWSWQDWTSLGGDLFFPLMVLVAFVDLRRHHGPNS